MNSIILDFFLNNWIGLIIVILLIAPVVPQKWSDPFGYQMNQKMNPPWPSESMSISRMLLKQLLKLFSEFAVNLGLRGSVSVLLFAVVGTDLYFNKVISTSTVIITIVAVIALYLEYMVATAESIEFFKLFKYTSKKDSQNPPANYPL